MLDITMLGKVFLLMAGTVFWFVVRFFEKKVKVEL